MIVKVEEIVEALNGGPSTTRFKVTVEGGSRPCVVTVSKVGDQPATYTLEVEDRPGERQV